MAWVIAKRNVLRNVRLCQLLLFATTQPVMFLLLFDYVFGGSIGRSPQLTRFGSHVNWLVPGIIVQTATFGASQTSVGLAEDLQAGAIDRLRSQPMARSAVLAGRTISGLPIGFPCRTSFIQLIAAFLLAVGFASAFSWVMASVELAVKDTETARTAGFLPMFPLVFASSVFVSVESLPDWLGLFADHQPVMVNAMPAARRGRAPDRDDRGGTVTAALAWSPASWSSSCP